MSPLSFYLYCFPLCLSAAYLAVRVTVFGRRRDLETEDLAWGWCANYSLFNLYFVWCWNYADAWRTGLLAISTLLVVAATGGQIGIALLDLRLKGSRWLARFFLAAALFVNIPIMATVIWRKVHNLSLL